MPVRENIRSRVHVGMKEIAICSPEIYESQAMQRYIAQKCGDADNQWIYKLINGEPMENERVYVNEPEFMICRDIHPGTDVRYLVIFKDLSLRTIRDLSEKHLPLLERIHATVKEFVWSMHGSRARDYRVFFHYTPSVFQLHAHVSVVGSHNQNTRMQPMNVLIRHLRRDPLWYRNGLILISLCRSMKALHVYKCLK